MAAGSLFTLLDDIASILDDVSILTKKAAAKTAGVLGDDLALNAQQVSGVVSQRELPVVWAVAKGSFLNKLILVPLALLISTFAPWGVTPLLMLGGVYLCFEGVEKLAHPLLHRHAPTPESVESELNAPPEKTESEAEKIKGAIRTDFVLSAEIITIALGTVAGKEFLEQLMVLSAIAIIMTVGVYGVVAGIVKLDDLGLYLTGTKSKPLQSIGRAILWFAPFFMKSLSIVGTAAMFLVGGGILTHGIPWLHHTIEHLAEMIHFSGSLDHILTKIVPLLINGVIGIAAGALALIVVLTIQKLRRANPQAS